MNFDKMNKIIEFNRLFEKADDLFDRKAYQIALDLINSALSIDTFIPQKRLFEAYLMSSAALLLVEINFAPFDINGE